ncbi:uncharacterized protein LOC116159564 [Photinus pyralis]|uniref:uncharacterized protein LOC116159564 n=1 Tax=Photinus pyralis TaxID=7054 RepID=UPI00126741F2|nr:uncharacterized protein LOC116159564 [Photinus pyralis]
MNVTLLPGTSTSSTDLSTLENYTLEPIEELPAPSINSREAESEANTSLVPLPKKPRLDTIESFDLQQLLQKTRTGQAIVNIYKVKKVLDSISQSYLVDIIVCFFLNNEHWRLTNDDFEVIAGKIIALFPNENKDVYFCPPTQEKISCYLKHNCRHQSVSWFITLED